MLGTRRLVVRLTRLLGAQAELWPDWRHFAFLTNRTDALELVESEHRQHAVVELAIRDLKDQALAHFPSGKFLANAAWTVIAALAHNLLRWSTLLGLPDTVIPTARTLLRRLLTVPGRITRTARTVTLRMPARWHLGSHVPRQPSSACAQYQHSPEPDARAHENDHAGTSASACPNPPLRPRPPAGSRTRRFCPSPRQPAHQTVDPGLGVHVVAEGAPDDAKDLTAFSELPFGNKRDGRF